ncbi:MAG: hypothetical protein M3N30_11165 [Bacteroidota bacterium]|nr:hypothetical protein [Bacteroidota bacterium]
MLKNYFKIAFRNLWRHRVFSFINILGLPVGMTACPVWGVSNPVNSLRSE